MTPASSVLLAVAAELSELAKASLPKLRKGEVIQQEWLEDGIYYRDTTLDGRAYRAQSDFRQRKSRRLAVKGGNCYD